MIRKPFLIVAITLIPILVVVLIYRALNNQDKELVEQGIAEENTAVSDNPPGETLNPEQQIKNPVPETSSGPVPYLQSIEIPKELDIADEKSQARSYIEEGYSKLKKGNSKEAISDFDKAIKITGGDPNSYAGLGLAYYMNQDMDKAVSALEQSVNLSRGKSSSNVITSYKLLGEIYYQRDDLETALKYWEKAIGLDPVDDPNLRRKFFKASKELETHKGFNRDLTRHFNLQYEGGEKADIGRKIISILEDAYSQIGGEMSLYPNKELTVILYSNQQFHYVTDGPAWSSGIYDGKIRLPIGGLSGNEPQLRQILFHEYTHSLVRSLTDRCPTWLNEGLAQYFEGRDKDTAKKFMRELHKRKSVIPLSFLEGSFLNLNKSQAFIVYLESFSAVNYMIDRYGLYRVKEILIELSKGNSIDDSFRSGIHIPYKEFETDWKKNLEG